jgi:hypothetical protein
MWKRVRICDGRRWTVPKAAGGVSMEHYTDLEYGREVAVRRFADRGDVELET